MIQTGQRVDNFSIVEDDDYSEAHQICVNIRVYNDIKPATTTKVNLISHHWRMLENQAIILKSVSKRKELSIYLAFSFLTVPPGKTIDKEKLTFIEVSQLINEE